MALNIFVDMYVPLSVAHALFVMYDCRNGEHPTASYDPINIPILSNDGKRQGYILICIVFQC